MSDLLSAATVANLTALNQRFMKETLTIIDVDTSDDGPVGTTERTTIGQFWVVSGTEAGEDQVKVAGKYRIEVPKTTVIAPTARIRRSNGETYAVKFPYPLDSNPVGRIIGLEDV